MPRIIRASMTVLLRYEKWSDPLSAKEVSPPLSAKVPIKLSGHKRTGCSLVSLRECLVAEVVMLPATQHLLGHGVEIVTPMLPPIIVVILARENTTRVA